MRFIKLAMLFLVVSFLSFSTIAQNKSYCKVSSTKFICPENLQVEKNKGSKNLYIGFDSKNKVYVYVFSPDKAMNNDALIEKALENVFSDIYTSKYNNYQIKSSNDFWGNTTWSQYEVGKFAKIGFNKAQNHTLHFQYVQLLLNKHQILAGFVYERFVGENAEEKFNGWTGGGNGSASSNLQELIRSITGEERPKLTPGGPPPPARS